MGRVNAAARAAAPGWLATVRGKGGGLRLAQKPEAIGVRAVVCQTEGAAMPAEAVDAFHAVLDRYTLADLTHNGAALAQVLFPTAIKEIYSS